MAKRIILMYISEVSGHHSATIAIENAIKTLAPDTEILNINAFNYTNPITEKIINRLYMSVIKATPQIWDYLYDNPAVVKNLAKIKEKIHKFNSPKMQKLFEKFKPDAVCCSQAFPCGMVADYKKVTGSKLPLVAVLTDYVPHSFWVYEDINYYITPSEEVASKLVQKGVAPDRVKPYGIPFDYKFSQPVAREAILKELGFDLKVPTILIMGGGQGLGPVKTIIKAMEDIKPDLQEIIVTGTNKKLYKSLKRKVKKYSKKIAVFGFTDKINELMSAADIIITKPGGITTAEALTKKLPMIIVKPIPGQEINNTVYLTAQKAAIKVDEPQDINAVIEDLLLNRNKLEELSKAAARISKPNASMDAARLLLSL